MFSGASCSGASCPTTSFPGTIFTVRELSGGQLSHTDYGLTRELISSRIGKSDPFNSLSEARETDVRVTNKQEFTEDLFCKVFVK